MISDSYPLVKIIEQSRNVHDFRMEYSAGWEQSYLLSSDYHIDNPKSKRDLIFKHLKEARNRGALVLMFGDIFCLMQGKGDRRGNKSSILPQHNKENYIDAVINEAIDILGEYADHIGLITPGNHETQILKFHETNPTERLVQGINSKYKPGQPVKMGGYMGYCRFLFSNVGNTSGRSSKKLFYAHGHGGGGEVTKGIIQSQRRAAYIADADFVVSGHVHDSVVSEWPKVRLSASGKIEHFTQHHIILPSYKEEFEDGFGGWHVERGAPPKPLGAQWLKFYYRNESIHHELVRAH